MPDVTSPWREIGDGVFVRHYRFFEQNIVAVVDRGQALVVDTRSTYRQARELVDDLRALGAPTVAAVVNTHGHYDHAFGNRLFRPAAIWGHERAVVMLGPAGGQRELAIRDLPQLARELDEVELDPPDRLFADRAVVEVGGRLVEMRHLGRGHTDNDIVLTVGGADVVVAGDLLESGAAPYFGDGYPLDWPATAAAILALTTERTVVVPGHGDLGGCGFVAQQAADIAAVVDLARRVHGGGLDLEAAVAASPFRPEQSREPIERALAQLRGELA
jgi:glyoxylase-like metal-dependent hydrolase (beta-lactamase superfamily II)